MAVPPLWAEPLEVMKKKEDMYIHVKVRLENVWKSWKKVSEKVEKVRKS